MLLGGGGGIHITSFVPECIFSNCLLFGIPMFVVRTKGNHVVTMKHFYYIET